MLYNYFIFSTYLACIAYILIQLKLAAVIKYNSRNGLSTYNMRVSITEKIVQGLQMYLLFLVPLVQILMFLFAIALFLQRNDKAVDTFIKYSNQGGVENE